LTVDQHLRQRRRNCTRVVTHKETVGECVPHLKWVDMARIMFRIMDFGNVKGCMRKKIQS